MNPQPQARAVTVARTAMIAVFLILIWLPMLDSIFQWDKTPQVNENRLPARFPCLGSELVGARDFISGLERYFNDHFGFRKRLIYWAQTWKRKWFRETWQSNVIIGHDGWLYGAWSASQVTENQRITTPFAPEELKAWRDLFEVRRGWLAKRNIHYLVVIPPDKQTIYPEHLPGWAAKSGPVAKLDQFMAYMRTNTTVEILDLRASLLQAKRIARTYHLTDSHWNQYGTFIACNEIIRVLSKQIPGLEPLSLESFDRKTSEEPGGNLASMLTGAYSMMERDVVAFLPRPPLPTLLIPRTDSNLGIAHQTRNIERRGKAIVFGDSFAEGLMSFLGYHFNEVTSYRVYDGRHSAERGGSNSGRAHVWIPSIIEEEKPDVVIDQILESLLYLEDPVSIKREDALE